MIFGGLKQIVAAVAVAVAIAVVAEVEELRGDWTGDPRLRFIQ